MTYHWLELLAWVIGAVFGLLAIRNQITQTKGIGPKTIQALTISIGIPFLLTLALEKVLNGETIAALAGSLLGIGIQKEKE